MHWSIKAGSAFGLLCATAWSGLAKENVKEKKSAKSGKHSDLRDVFPIPVSHSGEGLRVPSFENGKLKMYFNIELAKRIDDTHLAMTGAKVETFDDTGAPEMTIDLPASTLDLKTRIVTSGSPVKIRRSDFELTGDSMSFDTQTRYTRIIGGVRMLIFNRSELAGETAESPAESAPRVEGAQP